jgi:hypothetical protein
MNEHARSSMARFAAPSLLAVLALSLTWVVADQASGQSRDVQGVLRGERTTKVIVYSVPRLKKFAGRQVVQVRATACVASLTTNRRDAMRCFGDGRVLDPCFPGPGLPTDRQDRAYCPSIPFDAKDIVVSPSQGVFDESTRAQAPSRPSEKPWAMVLANGSLCRFEGGATTVVGNSRTNYLCATAGGTRADGSGGYTLGFPRRNTKTWTVLFSATPRGDYTRVRVIRAYL